MPPALQLGTKITSVALTSPTSTQLLLLKDNPFTALQRIKSILYELEEHSKEDIVAPFTPIAYL